MSLRLRRLFENKIRAALANHDGSGVGVAGGEGREHGGVGHAQLGDAVYAQAVVDHGHIIVTHFAGAYRVVHGVGFFAHVIEDLRIAFNLGAGEQFLQAVGVEGFALVDFALDANRFYHAAFVFRSGEEVKANAWPCQWVVGFDLESFLYFLPGLF